jgi:hypothetical protein
MAKTQIDLVLKAKDEASETLASFSGNLGNLITQVGKVGVAGAAIWAGFEVIRSVKDFLADSVSEALNAEEAQTRLKRSVEQSGASWDEVGTGIQRALTHIQAVTTFSDDEASGAFQRLTTITGDYRIATKALGPVLAMAKAMNIDVAAASKVVSVAIEGNTGALSRYGIVLDKVTKEKLSKAVDDVQRSSIVIEAVSKKFGDITTQPITSMGGQIKMLSNQLEEFKEQIGTTILQTGAAFVAPSDFAAILNEINISLGIANDRLSQMNEEGSVLPGMIAASDASGNKLLGTVLAIAYGFKLWTHDFAEAARFQERMRQEAQAWLDFADDIQTAHDSEKDSLERLRSSGYKPVADEVENLEARQRALRAAVLKGVISEEEFNRALKATRNEIEKLQGTNPGAVFERLSTAAGEAKKRLDDAIAIRVGDLLPVETVPKVVEALAKIGPEARKQILAAFAGMTPSLEGIEKFGRQFQNLAPGEAIAAVVERLSKMGAEAREAYIKALTEGRPYTMPDPIVKPFEPLAVGSIEENPYANAIQGVEDLRDATKDASIWTDTFSKNFSGVGEALRQGLEPGGDLLSRVIEALRIAEEEGISFGEVIREWPDDEAAAVEGAEALIETMGRLRDAVPQDEMLAGLESIGSAVEANMPNVDTLISSVAFMTDELARQNDEIEGRSIKDLQDLALAYIRTATAADLQKQATAIAAQGIVSMGEAFGKSIAAHKNAAKAIKTIFMEMIADILTAIAKREMVLGIAEAAAGNYGASALHFAAAFLAGAGAGFVRQLASDESDSKSSSSSKASSSKASKAATGGIVAGTDTGDVHPFLLEAGEAVVPKTIAASIFGGRAALIPADAISNLSASTKSIQAATFGPVTKSDTSTKSSRGEIGGGGMGGPSPGGPMRAFPPMQSTTTLQIDVCGAIEAGVKGEISGTVSDAMAAIRATVSGTGRDLVQAVRSSGGVGGRNEGSAAAAVSRIEIETVGSNVPAQTSSGRAAIRFPGPPGETSDSIRAATASSIPLVLRSVDRSTEVVRESIKAIQATKVASTSTFSHVSRSVDRSVSGLREAVETIQAATGGATGAVSYLVEARGVLDQASGVAAGAVSEKNRGAAVPAAAVSSSGGAAAVPAAAVSSSGGAAAVPAAGGGVQGPAPVTLNATFSGATVERVEDMIAAISEAVERRGYRLVATSLRGGS